MKARRKFYLVDDKVATNPNGFDLANEDALFGGRHPMVILTPNGERGFRQYPVPPLFICDPRKGRVHWDFEEYTNYWFISERMKAVLEKRDPTRLLS